MNSKQWMDGLEKTKVDPVNPVVGIEITCRLVMSDSDDYQYVTEVIDKCREVGAAEITKSVILE